MTSMDLKVEALSWLRFSKRLPYVCTEVGSFNADVIGCDHNHTFEIEVKVSKSDLRSEFTTKRAKHFRYKASEKGGGHEDSVPNYYYLYVPQHLEELAVELVQLHNSKYGVIVFYPEDSKRDGKRSRVARSPQKLHNFKPSEEFKRTMLLRMGSEICGRHIAVRKLTEVFLKTVENVGEEIAKQIEKLSTQEDFDGKG